MSTGKIALVTGGNRGIGKEIVRQLANKGWRIILTARDPKTGAQAASSIKGDVRFLALDVADDESIAQAAENFSKESDQLDVLINNAGIYPDEGFNILTVPRELLSKTFQTNVFGAIRVIQAFLPFLSRADQARIVNLSSGYGELGGLSSSVPSYCLSETDAEWSDDYVRSGAPQSRYRCELSLPRLGSNRYGWPKRDLFSGRRGGYRSLAGN